jgi:hypothetical protein
MSDEILNFGTEFDTLVQPAGDAAIDESAGLNMPNVADAVDAASSAPVDESAGLDVTPPPVTPDATPAPTADPGANTDSGIAPGENVKPAPAPAAAASPSTPAAVTDLSTKAPDAGASDAEKWLKAHPGEAGIIGKMMAGGATGAMTALAMRNKMQAEREAEERHRQDVIRRGQVPLAAPGTFTPKAAAPKSVGIIDAARGA